MQRKDLNKSLKKESRVLLMTISWRVITVVQTQAHHASQDDEEDDLTKIRRSVP